MKNINVIQIGEPVFEFIDLLANRYKTQLGLDWSSLQCTLAADISGGQEKGSS
jgi:hypothetical protein